MAISELECDLDADINILNSRIYTTRDLSQVGQASGEKGKKYLCIGIEIELEDFESVLDGAAYARPRLLIILGIMTFITQELFMSFHFHSTSTSVGSIETGGNNKFKFNKTSYLSVFRKIKIFLDLSSDENKKLFYSLVDRYRKAIFLENETEESMIHDDEVLLSYFHILELLSNKYYEGQKQVASRLVNQLVEKILTDIYLFEKKQVESELAVKRKLAEATLISELPVASKIMYMLQEQGMLTHRLKSFISDLVKDRNSVAHGRQVYQDRVIFPVPPFFPLIRNREYSFEMLRTLSGRAIAAFANLNHLAVKWNDISEGLIPTMAEVDDFITNKYYQNLSVEDFFAGKINDVTPYTISYYLLNKRMKVEAAIDALSTLILNFRQIEDEIMQLILSVVLIVDKVKGELKEKCIELIKVSSREHWTLGFSMRDFLYHLEYQGHKPKTLREMLVNKEVR